MRLKDLCEKMEYTVLRGDMDTEVDDVIYDSRKAQKGTVFVCIVGAITDGHKYIEDVVEKGVSAIVLEKEEALACVPDGITVIKTGSCRRALALMSAAYFGYPAKKLTTIGVTGTKGKTTTTYIIREAIQKAGMKAGIIGTIAVISGETVIPMNITTPESYDIHRYMAKMVEDGCEYVVMEVSSQGLKLDRTAGIEFDLAVFTNLSSDHIGPNEHKDFDEYLACKNMLFRQCRTGIINADDKYAERITEGHTCDLITFSADDAARADIKASDIRFLNENGNLGMSFRASGIFNCDARIHIPGRFSVYNGLATMAVCGTLGIPEDAVLAGMADARVKGRVEMVRISNDFSVVIDYAHNEMSTRSVLETLRQYDSPRLIAVFGCGGNRSKVRRYGIGKAAGELADLCVLTSDNPRFEEVKDINNDIKQGMAGTGGEYIEIEDRKEAIAYTITHARKGDMIIMLGKGHEEYIEIKGEKRHFSEREAISEIVEEIKSGARMLENDVTLI